MPQCFPPELRCVCHVDSLLDTADVHFQGVNESGSTPTPELMYGDADADPMVASRLRPLDWEPVYPNATDRVTWENETAPTECETVVRLRNSGTLPWIGFSLVYIGECIVNDHVRFGRSVQLGRLRDESEWANPAIRKLNLDEQDRDHPLLLPGEEEDVHLKFEPPVQEIAATRGWLFVDGRSVSLHPQMDVLLLLWVLEKSRTAARLIAGGRMTRDPSVRLR